MKASHPVFPSPPVNGPLPKPVGRVVRRVGAAVLAGKDVWHCRRVECIVEHTQQAL